MEANGPFYDPETIKLYRKISYPEDKELDQIVSGVYENVAGELANSSLINILEIGPGLGLFTIKFLTKIYENGKIPKYLGIEVDENMIKAFNQAKESIRYKAVKQNVRICNLDFWSIGTDPKCKECHSRCSTEKHYDIIILFFFIHLSARDFKDFGKNNIIRAFEGIDFLLTLLKDNGILLISETYGDHAFWSCDFTKSYQLDELLDAKNCLGRLQFFKLLRDCHQYLGRRGYTNLRSLSASDIGVVLEYLGTKGVTCPDNPVLMRYKKSFTAEDIKMAIGLGAAKRVFTTFPPELSEDASKNITELIERYANTQGNTFISRDMFRVYACKKIR